MVAQAPTEGEAAPRCSCGSEMKRVFAYSDFLRGEDPVEAVRGRLERTFFGLGLFAAINFFLCGAYPMREAIVDPLGATDVAVMVAGFALALASFALVFLVWPRTKEVLPRHTCYRESVCPSGPVLNVYGESVPDGRHGKHARREAKTLPAPV